MLKKIFNSLKRKVLKSEFNRNVLTLMTGTTIAQEVISLPMNPFPGADKTEFICESVIDNVI